MKLLRLFFFNDDTAYATKDAAFRAHLTPDAARKEVAALFQIGIVRKQPGKGIRYIANKRFKHFEPLQEFLRSTTEISDQKIVNKVKKAGTIRQITLSGIFTGALEPKVDILVVGDRLEERVLVGVVRQLEAELGRELRYASFTSQDFKYRVGVYDRLVRDVFDYAHRTILEKNSP